MIEKVSMYHPDKVADRIAGALVDMAIKIDRKARMAAEVMIGHGLCHIITESTVELDESAVKYTAQRIAGEALSVDILQKPQDVKLAESQEKNPRAGDNGIFKGVPYGKEERLASSIMKALSRAFPYDGKIILDLKSRSLVVCQSRVRNVNDILDVVNELLPSQGKDWSIAVNPLGYWTGGLLVDTGLTNRKIGSDLGRAVTGGGLCVSGDTEYLGEDLKWHKIKDYPGMGKVAQWNDGALEFVQPSRYIHNECDAFIKIWNDTKVSMELTPNHQVLIKTSKGNLIKHPASYVAEKLVSGHCNLGTLIHSFTYNGNAKNKFIDDRDFALQVAFCADGSILRGGPNRKWNGRIRVKKERKKARLRELLSGKEYRESVDGEYSIFWYNFPLKSKSLYECFHDEDFGKVYNELYFWDGDIERKTFRTTKEEDADFAQLVIASQGRVATINCDNRVGDAHSNFKYIRKTRCYTVQEYASTWTNLRTGGKQLISVEYEKERKDSYCFEVPSHNLVLRHNKRIFISGNCGKDLTKADVTLNIYAYIEAQATGKETRLMCAIGDEKVLGRPYREYMLETKLFLRKLGGFECLAEWGLM